MTQSGTSGGDRRLSVLVLTRHGRRGAASRLRLLDLLPGLVDSGIDATARAFFDDATLDRRNAGRRVQTAVSALDAGLRRVTALIGAGRYDVVLIEKEALPFVPWPVEGALLAGSRVVVDLGDARFLRYQSHRSPLVRRMLGGKIAALLRRAHVAVVGNAPLEAWARSAGARDVVVLPTSIDLARYRPRDAESEPRRPFTIGWIGSATTAGYLLPVAAVLAELARRRDVEVHLVGAGRCAPPGVRACSFAWAEETEVEHLSRFDVGIVPLASGPWEQAKSPYKLLQYMAMALPVVATPVGAARDVIRHGQNGFLAESADEWLRTLERLRDDAALRAQIGSAARRTVEAAFSRERALPGLADALWRAAAASDRDDDRPSR